MMTFALFTFFFFFFNDTATTEIYTLSLHDALPIWLHALAEKFHYTHAEIGQVIGKSRTSRSEEHTSELQSRLHLVCRLLLEKKKKKHTSEHTRREDCHRHNTGAQKPRPTASPYAQP